VGRHHVGDERVVGRARLQGKRSVERRHF
jgi:hypothetical protein